MIDTSKTLKQNILLEQFIPDHVFVYAVKGTLHCYDGNKNYTFNAGEYCIARKKRLARYKVENEFEPIIFCFDEAFLRSFQNKHHSKPTKFSSIDTFIKIGKSALIPNFIDSLKPYYKKANVIDEEFEDLKYEELLIILLKMHPELAGIFFDYGKPEKINIEEFMSRNFKFNVSMERFAYLTGRSISAFKRDFKEIFNETPSRWLVKRRLEEAHFLINNKNEKPSDIYFDLGFEDLSHFSFAFKKLFGYSPTEKKRENLTHGQRK